MDNMDNMDNISNKCCITENVVQLDTDQLINLGYRYGDEVNSYYICEKCGKQYVFPVAIKDVRHCSEFNSDELDKLIMKGRKFNERINK